MNVQEVAKGKGFPNNPAIIQDVRITGTALCSLISKALMGMLSLSPVIRKKADPLPLSLKGPVTSFVPSWLPTELTYLILIGLCFHCSQGVSSGKGPGLVPYGKGV
ncbi:hypothetical protein ACFE04_019677 [Oxalis oulophora]